MVGREPPARALVRRKLRQRWLASASNFQGRQGGFTMVELLVGVSIMALIVTVMASGVTQSFRAVGFQRTGVTGMDETRRVIPVITRDLRVATTTNLPTDGSTASLADGPVIITSNDPDAGPVITTYSLSGSNLVRAVDNGLTQTTQTVARNIAAAEFSAALLGTGLAYTVTLTPATDGTPRAVFPSTWQVYQRPVPPPP